VRALAGLPFAIVVTVCFDQLFETALHEFQKVPTVRIYDPLRREPKDFPRGTPQPNESPWLFKMHGCISEPDSIVVTDQDYIRFALRMGDSEDFHPVPQKIRINVAQWPSLFVGWSFRDYHLRFLWQTLLYRINPELRPQSYIIEPYPDRLFAEIMQRDRSLVFIAEDIWYFVPQLFKTVMAIEAPL
jgi:hypothetical protein